MSARRSAADRAVERMRNDRDAALVALAETQAKLDELTARRDLLLGVALDAGASARGVATMVGLTHPTVVKYAEPYRR